MQTVYLDTVQAGQRIKLNAIHGGRELSRRLLALGVNLGSEFEVLSHRGHGVVLARDGNRIALGRGIAEKLSVLDLGPIE